MKLTRLNVTTSTKLWCGIAALAAATGKDTESCRIILRNVLDDTEIVTGRSRVLKGIYVSEFTKALNTAGIDYTELWNHKDNRTNISFARYLLARKPQQGTVCIGVIPHHVFAFDWSIVIDNQHPNGISFFNYKYIEETIQYVYALKEFDRADLF